MEWMKKHVVTAIILATCGSCMLWMNGIFNSIEKDLVVIKTVLVMKQIMPPELCHNKDENH